MTSTQPSTEAGRALLLKLVHNGIEPHQNEPWLEARILAIEAEARANIEAPLLATIAMLREALERLYDDVFTAAVLEDVRDDSLDNARAIIAAWREGMK